MPISGAHAGSSASELDGYLGNRIADAVGIRLTHPDKLVYPGKDITKAQLSAYYAAVADRILRTLLIARSRWCGVQMAT